MIGLLVGVAGATSGCSASLQRSISPRATILPAALPLGSTAVLSYPLGTEPDKQDASGRFVISRVWAGATPRFDVPGRTFAPGFLAHIPKSVNWVGIDLTIVNTGHSDLSPGHADGPGAAVLYLVVNGQYHFSGDLSELGFSVGIPGCPFPFSSALLSGTSTSGCVAIAVPSGLKVATVGFDLTVATGGAGNHVAQWRA